MWINKYNGIISLVDSWVLLGSLWWWWTTPKCSSFVLVCSHNFCFLTAIFSCCICSLWSCFFFNYHLDKSVFPLFGYLPWISILLICGLLIFLFTRRRVKKFHINYYLFAFYPQTIYTFFVLVYLILYICRLAVVFLAFDVFFAIFCVVLACLIGIALCCCLPCIIAILYAVAGQVWGKIYEL